MLLSMFGEAQGLEFDGTIDCAKAIMRMCDGRATFRMMLDGEGNEVNQLVVTCEDNIAALAEAGDWVVRNDVGALTVCDAAMFEAKYRPRYSVSEHEKDALIWQLLKQLGGRLEIKIADFNQLKGEGTVTISRDAAKGVLIFLTQEEEVPQHAES